MQVSAEGRWPAWVATVDEILATAQLQALLGLVWPAASNLIAVSLLFAGGLWVPADIAGSSQPWLTTRRVGQREGLLGGEKETCCDDGAQARGIMYYRDGVVRGCYHQRAGLCQLRPPPQKHRRCGEVRDFALTPLSRTLMQSRCRKVRSFASPCCKLASNQYFSCTMAAAGTATFPLSRCDTAAPAMLPAPHVDLT
jgi:hypothetical protein